MYCSHIVHTEYQFCAPGPTSGGATYTRWGSTNCSNIAGTQEIYSGITAGSVYTHWGDGANHLCLVKGQLHA